MLALLVAMGVILVGLASCASSKGSPSKGSASVSRGGSHVAPPARSSKRAAAIPSTVPSTTVAEETTSQAGPGITTGTAPTGANPASFSCSAGGPGGIGNGTSVASGGAKAMLAVTHSQLDGVGPQNANATMTIEEAGAVLFEDQVAPVSTPVGYGSGQWSGQWNSFDQLCLQVPKSGLPLVYLNGFYGNGASCCMDQRIYFASYGRNYAFLDKPLGEGPATVEDLYGDVVTVSADSTFMGQFSCMACSAMPIMIYQFEQGQFVNVTRGFPLQVEGDAAKVWSIIQGVLSGTQQGPVPGEVSLDLEGLYPAWAADECELGNEQQAWSTLSSAAGAGQFASYSGAAGSGSGAYVSAVESFLVDKGYCA